MDDKQVIRSSDNSGISIAVFTNTRSFFKSFAVKKLIIKNPSNIPVNAGAMEIENGISIEQYDLE